MIFSKAQEKNRRAKIQQSKDSLEKFLQEGSVDLRKVGQALVPGDGCGSVSIEYRSIPKKRLWSAHLQF